MGRHRITGNLDVLLLSVLSVGPAHGYDVIAALKERSDGRFDLPEGTVYPLLHRLEQDGLLSSEWDASGGRRRRVYALTTEGTLSLAAGRRSWTAYSSGVDAVLGAGA